MMRTNDTTHTAQHDSGLLEEIARGGFGITHVLLLASIRVVGSAVAMRSRLVARTVDLAEGAAHEAADLWRGINDRQSEVERFVLDTTERVGVTFLERAGGSAFALASTTHGRTRLPLRDERAEVPQA